MKRTRHRKQTLFANLATLNSRLLSLQILHILIQSIQYILIRPLIQPINLLSNLLKKSSISNHPINQNPLFSDYNFSDNTLQAVYNPPISKSPIQHSAPVAEVNYTIPNSQKVLVTTKKTTTKTNN